MSRAATARTAALPFAALTPEQLEKVAERFGFISGINDNAYDNRHLIRSVTILGDDSEASISMSASNTKDTFVPVDKAEELFAKVGVSRANFQAAAIQVIATAPARAEKTDLRLVSTGPKSAATANM